MPNPAGRIGPIKVRQILRYGNQRKQGVMEFVSIAHVGPGILPDAER